MCTGMSTHMGTHISTHGGVRSEEREIRLFALRLVRRERVPKNNPKNKKESNIEIESAEGRRGSQCWRRRRAVGRVQRCAHGHVRRHVYRHVGLHACVLTGAGTCTQDMCAGMCMRINMCVDICIAMSIDMCVNMRQTCQSIGIDVMRPTGTSGCQHGPNQSTASAAFCKRYLPYATTGCNSGGSRPQTQLFDFEICG